MAIILGRNSKIAVSTDDSTYNDLGKVLSGSLSIDTDVADATTNDSAGFKEGEYADQQASVEATMKYDSSNTGQAALLTEVCTNKTKLWFRVRPKEAVGEKQWKFLATVESLGTDFSTGEVEELSCSAVSSGAVTMSAQT